MTTAETPYLIVSTDSHLGPSVREQLRAFCPPSHLAQYDAYADQLDATRAQLAAEEAEHAPYSPDYHRSLVRMREAPGVQDPAERIDMMDSQGIAAEVMFAGSGNGETMPFVGTGLNAGTKGASPELIEVGCDIWNGWLAEFCSYAPGRLLGVMQIAIWNVPAAVRMIEEGADAGLRVLNLPAPRSDYPPYTDAIYEPLWEVCERRQVTLATHSGGGERPLGHEALHGYALVAIETHWLSRRTVWQLIFGGVFDRHPGLRLVLSEQRANWVTETVHDLESVGAPHLQYRLRGGGGPVGHVFDQRAPISRRPSEYWNDHCFVGGSYLAPFEAARRNEPGMQNVLWGSDYPHTEGTWPVTHYTLRNTFAHVPEADTRRILGERALSVFALDEQELRAVADKVGPLPSEIARPIGPDEVIPENHSWAFREFGAYC